MERRTPGESSDDSSALRQEEPHDGEADVRVRPWGALLFFQFRFIWGGHVVAGLGQQMREAANIWLVYELSGSAFQLGLLGIFRALPLVLFGLFGGTLADVVDRKKLLLVSQAVNSGFAVALAALALTGNIQVWHIYVITFGSAAAMNFDQPARIALIPALVPRRYLTNAITLYSTARHAAMLVGPSMAGVVIAGWGAGAVYVLNVLAFIPILGALAFLRVPPSTERMRFREINVRQMLEGVRFIWSTKIIFAFVFLDTVAMLITQYRVLMPIFAQDILGVGEVGYGLLLSAPAFGFLVGSGLLLWAGDVRRKGMLVIVTTFGYAAAIGLFAASPLFFISLALIAAVGGLDAVGTIIRQTVLQLLVPDNIRGRATAVLHVFALGGPSFGQTITGSIAALLGAPGALILGAAGLTLAVFAVTARWRFVFSYRD